MKLGKGDRIPIGKAQTTPIFTEQPRQASRPGTLVALAKEAGVHPNSVHNFRARHPSLRHWTDQQVIQQLVQNKDQSEVAKRQAKARRLDHHNSFGALVYAQPPLAEPTPPGESQ